MAFDKKRAQVITLLKARGKPRTLVTEWEYAFVTALGEAGEKRPAALAMILRSDSFLTLMRSDAAKTFLEWLADFVEGSFDRPRHRPRNLFQTPVEKVADRARQLKREMCKSGKKGKEADAIEQAVKEASASGTNVTFDQVHTELHRSKQAKRK
jgi:hypothetical protein